MLDAAQHDLLQSFVSMPDPTYAEIFALREEVADLEETVSYMKEEAEEKENERLDAMKEIIEKDNEISRLRGALADALAWIASDAGIDGAELADTDKAFGKLYAIL